jgi:hypothetical protein
MSAALPYSYFSTEFSTISFDLGLQFSVHEGHCTLLDTSNWLPFITDVCVCVPVDHQADRSRALIGAAPLVVASLAKQRSTWSPLDMYLWMASSYSRVFDFARSQKKHSSRFSYDGVFTQPGSKCDLTKTAAHGFQRSPERAGLPATRETLQLGRPRRNSMIAALTSAGRSCWVQCPQPGSIWMSRSRGTTCFMLAICSAAPGNATTMS